MKIEVGEWTVDTNLLEAKWGYGYPVDLEADRTCAQILDTLAQVSGKTWGSPSVVGDLVKVFDAAFHLQGTLCGCGIDRRCNLTAAQIRRNLIDFEIDRRCRPFPNDGQGSHDFAELGEHRAHERARVRKEMGIA